MQVESMKLKFQPSGTKCLKLKWGILLSISAFKCNLHRYNEAPDGGALVMRIGLHLVGRCRWTL